jgi:tRNA pseudouridine55 synthase
VSRRPSRWHGLLPVYKTAGPTSHDVVDMARKALGERRIGHTGTLDPMAEGLLLLCVGTVTRLQQYLMRWDKTYRGEIRLGHATTTYDREGEPIDPKGDPPALDGPALESLRQRFEGEITQIPPPYSAKKVAGKKLYELARRGQLLEVEPKRVTVRNLELRLGEPDLLTVDATTSTGFYVRSLAHDLGLVIGCGAHLHHLCRLAMGPYTAADALPQSALETAVDSDEIIGSEAWTPIGDIQLPFAAVSLNRGATERFVHGQEVIVMRTGGESLQSDAEVMVRGPDEGLLGIGVVQAVLARGRTVSLRPAAVLQQQTGTSSIAREGTS